MHELSTFLEPNFDLFSYRITIGVAFMLLAFSILEISSNCYKFEIETTNQWIWMVTFALENIV